MEIKKEVVYNFNELYYIFLIQRLDRINLYLISDKNYPFALMEFKHWFIEIKYEIKQHIPELEKTLNTEIENAEKLTIEYETIRLDRSIHRRIKFPKLNNIELTLKFRMDIIYSLMMESIDRLNMFLKKEKSYDGIKSIYN